MAEQLGRNATLYVSVAGSTYTKVGEMKDSSDSMSIAEHESTSNDDALWQSFLLGHKRLTVDCTFNYDESDAGQEIIRNAVFSDIPLYCKYRPSGDTVGKKEYTGIFNVTSNDIDAPTQGVSDFSANFGSTGTVGRASIT